ncbi:MAG: hypothetical protein B7X76_00940 [Azorhizobium sp. 39-67-5]|nr:MAG: hypothetical protein B7X76_00940 [Azorhizobium sp. 39-67-5]
MGVLAQSIGGGGGNSGVGSAQTSGLPAATGTSFSVTVALGGTGGSGALAGEVNVANASGSSISTKGSGAPAILAQSIGGGGGSVLGGAGAAATSATGSGSYAFNLALGGSGGSGSDGGEVMVTNDGTISTAGGDSVGILAQSIGGGGGVGGSTDPNSTTNWTATALNIAGDYEVGYTAALSVGGSGGASGNGGDVNVANSGTISTSGERAYGILAHSVGGGGGSGGSASTALSGNAAIGVSVGGSGASGGDGGNVTITNIGQIETAGFNAHGIFAQSVGSGGGVGADGTTGGGWDTGGTLLPTASLGGNGDGASGGGGNGLNVIVDTGSGSIITQGDAAYGILAQSVGGGGGSVSAGGSAASNAQPNSLIPSAPSMPVDFALTIGGRNGTGGWGAPVTVTGGDISTSGNDAYGILAQSIGGGGGVGAMASGSINNSALHGFSAQLGGDAGASGSANTVSVTENGALVTSGDRSIGIVAQSIGGGGGMTTNANANLSTTQLQNNAGQNNGEGADVTVNLSQGASVTTSGSGAWGILAQSIGGGGGFLGDPSLNLSGPVSNTLADQPNTSSQNPDSGNVTVNIAGDISTVGTNAHGVFAQAVAGGGGIVGGCNSCSQAILLAGNSQQIYSGLATPTFAGEGFAVTVTQNAGSTIQTTGSGSIGIVAQSTGKNNEQTPITITIGGAVIGGTMTGYSGSGVGAAGILLSGGGAGTMSPYNNMITVEAGGSVSTVDGASGTAILSSYGYTTLANSGTVTGSILLASFASTYTGDVVPAGTIENNAGGVIYAGASIVASSLTNSGTINPYGPGTVGITNLSGNFVQNGGGVLAVDINSAGTPTADLLVVSGTGEIDGTIAPNAINLLPGAYLVAAADSLSTAASAPSSALFDWTVVSTETSLSISPTAHFADPAGIVLTPSQVSLAQYLQAAWNNADSNFAHSFAQLTQVSAAQYGNVLNTLAPLATQSHASALSASSGTMLGSPLSCPVFLDGTAIIGQDNCVWIRTSGWQSRQTGVAGYTADGMTMRFGGQREIAPNWFLGAAFGLGEDSKTMAGGSTGAGHTFDGSVALKYSEGPWLVAVSAAIGGGSYHTDRVVNLPWVYTLLPSDQTALLAGVRLRTAYELAFEDWYVRPYLDLDLTYVETGSFQETGPADLALDVRASRHTGVTIRAQSPARGNVELHRCITVGWDLYELYRFPHSPR